MWFDNCRQCGFQADGFFLGSANTPFYNTLLGIVMFANKIPTELVLRKDVADSLHFDPKAPLAQRAERDKKLPLEKRAQDRHGVEPKDVSHVLISDGRADALAHPLQRGLEEPERVEPIRQDAEPVRGVARPIKAQRQTHGRRNG